MSRIYAVIVNGLLIALTGHFALEANHPLKDMLAVAALISLLNVVVILLGGYLPSKVKRYLRPVASVGNICLLILLLPLALILLSLSADKGGPTAMEDIVTVSLGMGLVLLTIVLNLTLIRNA